MSPVLTDPAVVAAAVMLRASLLAMPPDQQRAVLEQTFGSVASECCHDAMHASAVVPIPKQAKPLLLHVEKQAWTSAMNVITHLRKGDLCSEVKLLEALCLSHFRPEGSVDAAAQIATLLAECGGAAVSIRALVGRELAHRSCDQASAASTTLMWQRAECGFALAALWCPVVLSTAGGAMGGSHFGHAEAMSAFRTTVDACLTALSTATPTATPATSRTARLQTTAERWASLKKSAAVASPAMEKILAMDGLESVKASIYEIVVSVVLKQKQQADPSKGRYSAIFTGNPGTGKTTMARLYAELLVERKAITGNAVIEASGVTLADEGVDGMRKRLDAIYKAGGGLLFVDEAYQLQEGGTGGRQVINMFLTEIENNIGKLVVVLAGYSSHMEKLVELNEGIPSRFPITCKFHDYDDAILLKIFDGCCKAKRLCVLDPKGARIAIARLGLQRNMPGFANARAVHILLEAIEKRQAMRVTTTGSVDVMALTFEDLVGSPPPLDLSTLPEWQALNRMVGLARVKKALTRLLGSVRKNWELELLEQPRQDVCLNRLFVGNPGTGKTTVAQLYAGILKHFGLLSKGEVVLKTASDFVGSVVGESEKRTIAILESAVGRVLVIDEAYGLHANRAKAGADPYREAVINTIVERVQNTPGQDMCVLMLGYKDQMEEMLRDANPGLRRRFDPEQTFEFDDYTTEELRLVMYAKLKAKGLTATDDAVIAALRCLDQQRLGPNFGNGGAVETLLSQAVLRMEGRLGHLSAVRRARTTVLEASQPDVAVLEASHPSTSHRTTVLEAVDFEDVDDAADAADIGKALAGLTGCDHIAARLRALQHTVKASLSRGLDPLKSIETTYLFTGAPGTGKTTVARCMGRVFKQLGVLPSHQVVEVSASDLIASFVGQTGPKVRATFEKAAGKVLFIDEAYRLDPARNGGAFAAEAIDEMVALLTDVRFHNKIVVIIAGYPHDIDVLLDANAGLRSRFTEKIYFHDFDAATVVPMFMQNVLQRGYEVDLSAAGDASRMLELAAMLVRAPHYSNGRDVDTWAKKAAAAADSRLADEEYADRDNDETQMRICDISEGLQQVLRLKPAVSGKPHMPALAATGMRFATDGPCSAAAPETSTARAVEPPSDREMQTDGEEQGDGDSDDEPGRDGDNFLTSLDCATRDAGVPDDEWERLQTAKRALRAELQRREEEKKRLEELARTAAEAERKKAEARLAAIKEQQRMEAALQARVQAQGCCPVGYAWIHLGGGRYRCAGGSHFTVLK